MKRSRRELSIDVVVHRCILKHNQITLFPSFTLIPKTGVSFYCEGSKFSKQILISTYPI